MCFFECVGFTYVVLDLVCSAILPSDWLAEPCPNDAYVEEWVATHLDRPVRLQWVALYLRPRTLAAKQRWSRFPFTV